MTIHDITNLPTAIGALLRGDADALKQAIEPDEEPADTDTSDAAAEAATR